MYGAVPPVAEQLPLYATPSVALGRLQVKASGAGVEEVKPLELLPPQLTEPIAMRASEAELRK